MTFCKVLATAERDGETVTAYENVDKFSSVKRYEIVVARESIAVQVIPTARTTWKKKFNELVKG
jgi:hypothetical protein